MTQALKPFMIAAALAGTPMLEGCQTTKTINMVNCQAVNANQVKQGLPEIIRAVVPGFRISKPNMPCLYSQDFLALVDQLNYHGNDKNHYMLKAIKDTYQELMNMSKESKFAAQTFELINLRLPKGRMEEIDAAYEKYKPQTLSQNQESACINVRISEFGIVKDQRICRSSVSFALPASSPNP